jgi:hypothetical protein
VLKGNYASDPAMVNLPPTLRPLEAGFFSTTGTCEEVDKLCKGFEPARRLAVAVSAVDTERL